jgi:hypothetical protein
MGANSTQAQGLALFFIAFVLIAGGLAENISFLYILVGLVSLGASIALFLKCKPWEHKED